MRQLTACLCLALAVSVTGCGSYVPLPSPATPKVEMVPSPAARREPPPPRQIVEHAESPGLCAHADMPNVIRFHGHYNASDGNHYHGWEPPMAKPFWVVC